MFPGLRCLLDSEDFLLDGSPRPENTVEALRDLVKRDNQHPLPGLAYVEFDVHVRQLRRLSPWPCSWHSTRASEKVPSRAQERASPPTRT